MFGKSLKVFGILLLCISFTGCAKARYAAPEPETRVVGGASRAEAFRFTPSGDQAWLSWEQKPTDEEYGSFILKIGRANFADGSPLPLDTAVGVEVVLWMPAMGHGSNPVALEKIDIGTYRVSEVFFTMPGDWEIRVRRTTEAYGVEETALAIRI
ncbi:MAG: hypothetical protein EOP11_07270 [Proteobacteria bacterium]|nr:MAG: hypothetical protein EOP11_07270 [Pseudomonadota bacterium]